MPSIYLDWAASAPPWQDLLQDFVLTSQELYANTSSKHTAGKLASLRLETSRTMLAEALQCPTERLYFTSGGTEADHIPLLACLLKTGKQSIVISGIEHSAIDEQANMLASLGVDVRRVRPDGDGFIDPAAFSAAVSKDTSFVSVMTVNNETGAIQPIAAIVKAVAEASKGSRKPFFHTDAVQALGKIPFSPGTLGVDGAAFSAHKLGGPRGIGALYLSKPLRVLATGGGQESSIRSGTHNLAGAEALAKATARACAHSGKAQDLARLLETRLIEGISSIPGATVVPATRKAGDPRYSPFILCASFPGLGGETMMRVLDDAGIAVSTGSACSSGKQERRVLNAMGVDRDISFASIRISTGRNSSAGDIDTFLEMAASLYARFKT
ncbi:MAG: cysteine desulfurase family protein [Clostridia bacterium]|jgi:cysteine desulfurase